MKILLIDTDSHQLVMTAICLGQTLQNIEFADIQMAMNFETAIKKILAGQHCPFDLIILRSHNKYRELIESVRLNQPTAKVVLINADAESVAGFVFREKETLVSINPMGPDTHRFVCQFDRALSLLGFSTW